MLSGVQIRSTWANKKGSQPFGSLPLPPLSGTGACEARSALLLASLVHLHLFVERCRIGLEFLSRSVHTLLINRLDLVHLILRRVRAQGLDSRVGFLIQTILIRRHSCVVV